MEIKGEDFGGSEKGEKVVLRVEGSGSGSEVVGDEIEIDEGLNLGGGEVKEVGFGGLDIVIKLFDLIGKTIVGMLIKILLKGGLGLVKKIESLIWLGRGESFGLINVLLNGLGDLVVKFLAVEFSSFQGSNENTEKEKDNESKSNDFIFG